MVLPLLVAGGYGAAALASAAGAARLRRQLAKMAAGPRGDPLSADVPLRNTEREVARLGRTLVISDELQVRERGDTLHTLFDYVLLSSERIVLHNAHSTDEEFHEADVVMSVEVRIPASSPHAQQSDVRRRTWCVSSWRQSRVVYLPGVCSQSLRPSCSHTATRSSSPSPRSGGKKTRTSA